MNANAPSNSRSAGGPVVFTVAEGQALDLLAALLGRGRGDLYARALPFTPRRELLEAGSRRIANMGMRWMLEGGGWRDRIFLRDRTRAHGRVWDGSLGAGFELRYTPASLRLWLECAKLLPEMAEKGVTGATGEAERKPRKGLQALTLADGTATGDWVFFALAMRGLESFRLDRGDLVALQRKLRFASPLAALLYPDTALNETELRLRFAKLTHASAARLVECGETRLARAWAQQAEAAMKSREAPGELTQRWTVLGRTLALWLEAIDRARRLDLARSLLYFVADVTRTVFAAGGESVRAQLAATPGIRSLTERDALLKAVASVADLATALQRRRDALAAERYGDERYEESQVLLRDYEEILQPARRQAEGVARALSGTIG